MDELTISVFFESPIGALVLLQISSLNSLLRDAIGPSILACNTKLLCTLYCLA